MSKKKKNTSPDEGEGEAPNYFDSVVAKESPQPTSRRNRKNTSRGRLDIVRESAHRGGKTVTVISGFKGIGIPEIKELAKKIQKSCGVGGAVKGGRIEIQGDNREVVKRILEEAGFNPVFAGG
ncbi:UNVERIFIED_CONTAM: hypothetical protein GTU68_059714 [Idotea baltica]|nr:hypothetical protein [Idotea baltica]